MKNTFTIEDMSIWANSIEKVFHYKGQIKNKPRKILSCSMTGSWKVINGHETIYVGNAETAKELYDKL